MKRLSLLALSMLLTCTLFAADIFLRGSVNSWEAPGEFKFATSDNVVYTLEKSFDLFGEFKFAGADWTVGPDYGSGGGAVELDTPLKLAPSGSNFECGSNSYKVTKIVLNLLENSATIYGEGGELEITSWTVCGSAAVFGTEFDAEDTSNDMEPVGGVYQLKKNGIALAADAIYEYKFVANHIWGIDDFPKGYNENITFEVETDGIYNITFSWNPATKAYSAIPTSVTPPIEFDSYIAIGDAALFYVDWTPSPIGVEYFTLETTDGIHYTKTVENVPIKTAGTFAYGFSKNGSTTEILFADKSKTVTVDEAGAYNIAVSLTVAPGEEPKAEAILTKVDPGTTYYIAGNGADFAPDVDWCCGENWNEKGCPMESGFFTRDLPAGTYLFKITDGTLDNNWGYDAVDATQSTAGYYDAGGNNIGIKLSAELSTVGVKFDGSKIVLEWTAKDTPVPPITEGITVNVTVPEGTPACFFYGEMSDNKFVEMTMVDATHYTTKFEGATSIGWGYLFCYEADNWDTKSAGGDITVEPVDGVINVEITWINQPSVPDVWSVVGDAALGLVWTPEKTTDDMQFVGGAYQLVKTGLVLEAGDYEYKFAANHQWGKEYPASGNLTLNIPENGTYKVTFSLNATGTEGSAVAEKEVDPGFDSWTLVGDMPPFPKSWTILPGFDLQTEDGKIYTLSAETEFTVTEFEYGFRKNYTEEYAPLAEKYTATLAEGTGEYKVDIALDFTDAAAPKVSVKFTKIPEPVVTGITVNVTVPEGTPACFFYGDMSGNTFVEMTKVDDTHYTTKFEDKESIGWGYLFCYEADNWDTKSAGGDITVEPVDGVINVEITWINQPSVPDVWSVVGDAALGLVWTPEKTTDDMQFVGGAYQLVKTGLVLEAGDYEYKFAANHQWGKEYPASGNLTLNIPENGTYKVTFSLNATGTEGSAVAEKEVDPGFDSWTLVGDMPPFPAAWTVEPAFDLQTTDGVVYTLVADDVDMTVDKFQYGFRKNHTEDFAPLEAKYTATLAEGTGSYKVEITLDFTVATDPKVTVNFTKNVTPTYDYYIAGNGDGLNGWTCGITWDPAGCGMAEGQYAAHVQPGTYEFKITNGKWATEGGKEWGVGAVDAIKSTPGYEGTDNVRFSVSSEANITVSFDGTSIILLSDVPFGEATITSWTAVGEAGLFENAWTPTDESNDMQFVGGVYQLVKTGLTLEAKKYLYKFTANHTWSVSEIPSGNATLTIAEAGTYKVTFYLNPATGEFDAVPEKQVDPGYDTWTLVGDMPPFPVAWTAIPAFDLTTTDGVVYTMTADDVDMPVETFQYGFRKNHTEEYAPLDEKYTATLTEGTGKYSVDVKLDFTVAANPKVEVIFTKKPEPIVKGITVNVTVPEGTPACFFYGDMSGDTFVEMTKVDDTHYTTKFEDKESIGWGYTFCWEADNWSTQNVERDFTVEPVDGVINVEVSGWLTNPGVEYHYTTYTHWEIMTDWDGGDWTWQSLEKESDGIFSAVAPWGTGTGVNVGSDGNPIKKDWYPAGDPYLTIQEGLNAGQAVKVTLTVIDDQTVKIDVVDANPTSADEAVEDSIYATNGTVFCSTPFEVYNLVGQNVTAQNGSLFGIYIVKTANTVKTVSVK